MPQWGLPLINPHIFSDSRTMVISRILQNIYVLPLESSKGPNNHSIILPRRSQQNPTLHDHHSKCVQHYEAWHPSLLLTHTFSSQTIPTIKAVLYQLWWVPIVVALRTNNSKNNLTGGGARATMVFQGSPHSSITPSSLLPTQKQHSRTSIRLPPY